MSKKRKKEPRRSRVVRRTPDGRVVQLSGADADRVLGAAEAMRRRFVEKFGRDPRPDDPVFFDPDADEPREMTSAQLADIEREATKAMRATGISEAYIYAWKKTGMLLTTDNADLFSEEDLDEFRAALDEARGPRVWALEPDEDVDVDGLDPDDPDDRRTIILADHPEAAKAIRDGGREVEPDGRTFSPLMHIAMHEIVLN